MPTRSDADKDYDRLQALCYGVVHIQEKMREHRLRSFGHILRATEQSVEKIAHVFQFPGRRPRGRTRQHWADTLRKDLKIVGVQPEQADKRSKW
ncbi:hypothetical protein ANCDUO_24832 [Ancylostoma duodenale]|uniref:Uncharacterized protein n=1 Tax=Ancylostoma duodenale TaxID=51022 RepID=A0A0C2FJR5_9BILA|nr:hypothetical protein ANCDUO_24832 [Ancylostoma duodenale]